MSVEGLLFLGGCDECGVFCVCEEVLVFLREINFVISFCGIEVYCCVYRFLIFF